MPTIYIFDRETRESMSVLNSVAKSVLFVLVLSPIFLTLFSLYILRKGNLMFIFFYIGSVCERTANAFGLGLIGSLLI